MGSIKQHRMKVSFPYNAIIRISAMQPSLALKRMEEAFVGRTPVVALREAFMGHTPVVVLRGR